MLQNFHFSKESRITPATKIVALDIGRITENLNYLRC
jgi:hypothetical protein